MKYFTKNRAGTAMLISSETALFMYKAHHEHHPRTRQKMPYSNPVFAWSAGTLIDKGTASVWGEKMDDRTLFKKILAGTIGKVASDA